MKETGPRGMRTTVLKALKRLDAFAVENLLDRGTPDICYADGLIELKVAVRPKRDGPVRVRKFTREQRCVILRRSRVSSNVRVLLLLEKDWFLLPGGWAAEQLGNVREEELWRNAERAWRGKLGDLELLQFLQARNFISLGLELGKHSEITHAPSRLVGIATNKWRAKKAV